MHQTLLLIHRYAGLLLAVPLTLVALSGGLLAFHQELDRALNPELLRVAVRNTPPLDPFTLRQRAEAADPRLRVDRVDFRQPPGESYAVWAEGRIDPARGEAISLPYDQLYLDPYTGETLGSRERGRVGFDRQHFVDTVFELHRNLLGGHHGATLVGWMALLWTIDCFIGFYLTLPPLGRSFRARWRPAWQIKRDAAPTRRNFDRHRATGLWLWPMLLVLAWSGVAFNLGSAVYRPLMSTFLPMSVYEAPPGRAASLENPALDWRQAYTVGRRLMAQQAARGGFAVEREEALELDRVSGLYTYVVRANDEAGRAGATRLSFDADHGALRAFARPALEPAGDAFTRWLVGLHTATVFGRPMQFVVAAIGLLIPLLALAGVLIWWRRQRIRRRQEARRTAGALAAV